MLNWIWGIGNKTYIAFLCFLGIIPIIGPIFAFFFSIWLGIQGNKLAWKNKEWKSIEQFNRIQRQWAACGAILTILGLLTGLLAILISAAGY